MLEMQRKIDRLESQLANAQYRASKYEEQNEVLLEARKKADRSAEWHEGRASSLLEENRKLVEKLSKMEDSSANERHWREMAEVHSNQLQDTEDKLEGLQKAHRELRNENGALKRSNDELEREMESLRGELESSEEHRGDMVEMLESEKEANKLILGDVEELRAELERCENKYEEALDKWEESELDGIELADQAEELAKLYNDARDDVAYLKGVNDALVGAKDDLIAKNEQLLHELDKSNLVTSVLTDAVKDLENRLWKRVMNAEKALFHLETQHDKLLEAIDESVQDGDLWAIREATGK